MTHHEQIIARPDTYIGSIEINLESCYIYDQESKNFKKKNLNIVPGLFKIFDEIWVNSCDNKKRDKTMKYIEVNIDKEKGSIKVKNDGEPIPIEIHKDENILIPIMIFGQLLTGSNYDDDVKKITGGKNGYGAKLANIFSLKFILKIGNKKLGKECVVEWTNNMYNLNEPKIMNNKDVKDYVEIEFFPDFKKFGIENFGDHYELFKKRVFDIKGCFGETLKVVFNDEEIKIKNFYDYSKLYLKEEDLENSFLLKDLTNKNWEVIIGLSKSKFKQISFVNSIWTSKGGKHVNLVLNQIIEKLTTFIQKNYRSFKLKKYKIKNYFSIFINCTIYNPSFSSQTKEELITKVDETNYTVSDYIVNEWIKTNIIKEMINSFEKGLENKIIKQNKKVGKRNKLIGIDKLEDANFAGSKNSEECTLILTEGDSAKSLAMAGIQIVGRDKYGVFPLKGKFINVRGKSIANILKNEEVKNLLKILGLEIKDDKLNLRYGKLMIMADQDTDGSHIKGLIINFIHNFWPDLLKNNNFLKQFVTPIIKCKKGKEFKQFFSISDYENWKEQIDIKKWSIKYYKGLGTSDNKEGKEYFSNLEIHEKDFLYNDIKDENDILLAFDKNQEDNRKTWIANHLPENIIDYKNKNVSYSDFINKELIHFSIENNLRCIASLCDGLKPGSRKILFSCFKRKLIKEIKVAQLSGYVAEHSAYHHGENSLQSTIVNLAQNFVGSNNINLLQPNGQFGSRHAGGKDHASARYIHTNLSKITRYIFKEEDDHIIEYLEDDGQKVEPKFYIPILPMILVNGCKGIGTGWSTDIPNYNPRELVNILKNKIKDKNFKLDRIKPYYKNFKGEIESDFINKRINIKGIFEYNENKNVLNIKELPIGTWTQEYKKKILEEYIKKEKYLNDFDENHKTNDINFKLKLKKDFKNDFDFDKNFKLSTSKALSNLVLFNDQGKIFKYESEIDILNDFINIRLNFYEKRKIYLISEVKRRNEILKNKMKFIKYVIDDKIKIKKVPKKEILNQLNELNFIKFSDLPKIRSNLLNKDEENEDEYNKKESEGHSEYNYLLNMNFWSLSEEQIEKLKKELKENSEKLKIIENKSIEEMWLEDLDNFIIKWDEIENLENKEIEEFDQINDKNIKKGKNKKNKKIKKDKKDKKQKSDNKPQQKKLDFKSKKPIYLGYLNELKEEYFEEEIFVDDLKNYYDKKELINKKDEDLNPIQKFLKYLIIKKENNNLEIVYDKKKINGIKEKKRLINISDSE